MSHPNHHAFRTPPVRRASHGFTLIELMITVAVGVILVSLALPSFQSVFTSGRINSQANEFVATLQLARMEAVRHNRRVVVCPSTDQTSCQAGSPATWTGWLAFVDDGGYSNNFSGGSSGLAGADANDGKRDNGETILRSGTVNTPVKVLTSGNISGSSGGAITFYSDGMARDVSGGMLKGTISVCVPTAHPPQNVRNVVIYLGSRISVARASGGGTCAAPANPTSSS